MAALVLSIGGAAAGALFGPVGAIAGRIAGALVGNMIDRSLFGGAKDSTITGPRLGDLDIMASTEGAPIPRLYGRARLSGQVIWATELEEVVSTRDETAGGKGFAKPTTTTTTYSYFANFAVGLCEGEIASIGRIWADGKLLDISRVTMRLHRGSETQPPDDLIVAKEGAAFAPAYRGLAYIVFERLALEEFGNRLPQLSFEIVRPVGELERMLRAVTLIPGTTEFGYEPSTIVQTGAFAQSAPDNRHIANTPSNVTASLDALQALCPNLERVAIVVAWFGDDLRAGRCQIRPGVERADKVTSPALWSVSGQNRAGAYVVSQIDGRPAFGGTPSDDSVRHLIAELKERGLKITFYPFVMMDVPPDNDLADPWSDASSQPAYPWRGRITCDPAPGRSGSPQGTSAASEQVNAFFTSGSADYRAFVLHYANLVEDCGGVDAFLIGSELRALTRVRGSGGVYPAVAQLFTLAADVKAIVGTSTIVTYGADWTEYGSDVVTPDASEVRFPLDPLWASANIDVVGIDHYPPLADWRDDAGHLDAELTSSIYDRDYLRGNVAGGEAFDWYYAGDAARATQTRLPITDGLAKPWIFRPKDFVNWWSRAHFERVAGAELVTPTAWIPRSKPIWLTEVGCPAVDKGANQPSNFPDPKSSDAGVPYFSNGARDDLIQRRMLEAVLGAFDPQFGATLADNPASDLYDGRMVDVSGIHAWTWDARPYPVFPAAEHIWADAPNWQTGHWLTGRLGNAPLDALVEALLRDSGVGDIDATRLRDICDGYVVDRPMSPRAMIEPLAMAFAFDATSSGGDLIFVPRGGMPLAEIAEDDLVEPEKGARSRLTRAQETELPREIAFGYTDVALDYRRAAVTSRRLVAGSTRTLQFDFALVTNDAAASRRADIWLQDLWAGRESIECSLAMSHIALTPGDVVAVTIGGRRRLFEIGEFVDTQSRRIKARSIDPGVFALPLATPRKMRPVIPPSVGPPLVVVLDLPSLDSSSPPVLTRLAVSAQPWPGSVTVWRSSDGTSFEKAAIVAAPAIVGATLDALAAGPVARWDHAGSFRVRLAGGSLSSRSDARVLDGANIAALQRADGAWEVLQFANAVLVDAQTYRLSRLLRGQGGSEQAMGDPLLAGAPFVLLNEQLAPIARGLSTLERPMQLRVVASGRSHDDAGVTALSVTPLPTALIPLAPAHVAGRRNADGVRVTWIRRTRFDGDGWGAEPPLGEDSESYALDIMSGADVVRSLTLGGPTALYLNADELADFGAPQSSLHVRVAQISSTVGRGYAAERTLTL